MTTLSLYLLDVPYSLALGVFMAVFDLISLVGATLGSVVVIASGFIFVGVRTGVILFVIVNVYQQVGALLAIPIAGTIQAVMGELLAERAARLEGLPTADT